MNAALRLKFYLNFPLQIRIPLAGAGDGRHRPGALAKLRQLDVRPGSGVGAGHAPRPGGLDLLLHLSRPCLEKLRR